MRESTAAAAATAFTSSPLMPVPGDSTDMRAWGLQMRYEAVSLPRTCEIVGRRVTPRASGGFADEHAPVAGERQRQANRVLAPHAGLAGTYGDHWPVRGGGPFSRLGRRPRPLPRRPPSS